MHLLMIAYANSNDSVGVQNVFTRYTAMEFLPTTAVINTVLKTIVNSSLIDDWNGFMQTYSLLFKTNDLEPDHNTFTELLRACVKGNRVKDAMLIINEVMESDIKLTDVAKESFRQIVGEDIYNELSPKFPKYYIPNTTSKLSILAAVDKKLNFKKLWGVEPREESSMERLRRNPEKGQIFRSMIDNGDYYEVIRYYASCGDIPSVKNLMEEMLDKNYEYDVEMMNTLAIAHSKNGDYIGTQDVVNEMRKTHLRPNVSTMRILMTAHAIAGNPEGAQSVLKAALKMNLHPGKSLRVLYQLNIPVILIFECRILSYLKV